MLGSVLLLMLTMLLWLTPKLRIKKSLLKCNCTIRKRLPRCFFFFQAEDGIRDADVTGVQTYALPISLESIERIEIVEGPLSVSYGTDALAGTINIITKKNQARRFEVNSNNYFESSGKVNNTRSEERRVGKECRYRWAT